MNGNPDSFQGTFDSLFGHLGLPALSSANEDRGRSLPQSEADKGNVEVLERQIAERDVALARIAEGALIHVPVADIIESDGDRKRVIIVVDSRKVEVAFPDGHTSVAAGDVVRVTRDTLQIVGVAPPDDCRHGVVATFIAVVSERTSEVSVDGQSIVVHNGKLSKFEPGVRMVLDTSRIVVLEQLADVNLGLFGSPSKPVEWEEVGGLEDAKQDFRDAIEAPVLEAELFQFYKKKIPSGILLFGPPGCGKTYLVKAAVTAHERVNKLPLGVSGALYLKGPELLSKFVGVTEQNLRHVFAIARGFHEKYGCPLIVFFDEADALFKKRGAGISSDVSDTIVPTLLTEMDGFEDSRVLAIFATNRVDMLDPALLRDGRIDKKIFIGRPTRAVAEEIFNIHLRGIPLHEATSPAVVAANSLFSSELVYTIVSLRDASDPEKTVSVPFTLGNLASGAMIAGIVEKATDAGFRRDRKANERTGVSAMDIADAVKLVFKENANLNHSDDLGVFMEGIDGIKERLKGIEKVRQGAT